MIAKLSGLRAGTSLMRTVIIVNFHRFSYNSSNYRCYLIRGSRYEDIDLNPNALFRPLSHELLHADFQVEHAYKDLHQKAPISDDIGAKVSCFIDSISVYSNQQQSTAAISNQRLTLLFSKM